MKDYTKMLKKVVKSQELLLGELKKTKPSSRSSVFKRACSQLSSKKRTELWIKSVCPLEKGKFIYIISLGSKMSSDDVREMYMKAKALNKARSFARINEDVDSAVIYVGKSKTIESRLKQHFGLISPSVYSLQMDTWIHELKGQIVIEVIRFDETIKEAVLQVIEDGFSDQLKPMFGRKGAL